MRNLIASFLNQSDSVLGAAMVLTNADMDGVAATRAIRQQFPTVQVIALTGFKEEGLVQKALQAGAIGYLLKDVSADELAQAIRAAQAGRSTLSRITKSPAAQNAVVARGHGPHLHL